MPGTKGSHESLALMCTEREHVSKKKPVGSKRIVLYWSILPQLQSRVKVSCYCAGDTSMPSTNMSNNLELWRTVVTSLSEVSDYGAQHTHTKGIVLGQIIVRCSTWPGTLTSTKVSYCWDQHTETYSTNMCWVEHSGAVVPGTQKPCACVPAKELNDFNEQLRFMLRNFSRCHTWNSHFSSQCFSQNTHTPQNYTSRDLSPQALTVPCFSAKRYASVVWEELGCNKSWCHKQLGSAALPFIC